MDQIISFESSELVNLSDPPMAHVSISIGHYIIFLGGYRIHHEDGARSITTFDKYCFLCYNIINHQLSTITCNYDHDSIGNYPTELFCSSGLAATCVNSRIYLFGGYSLTKQESCNALYFIDINKKFGNDGNIDFRLQSDIKPEATLKFICGSYTGQPNRIHLNYPSYRDKCSLVHWLNRLIVFGGYGINFNGEVGFHEADEGTNRGYQNFLRNAGIYIAGSYHRGWNNQVLVYDLNTKKWINPATTGNVPCPRAAHCAEIIGNRMLIFGGRLGLRNNSEAVRTNDCYYLNLDIMEWTKIEFSNLSSNASMVGRSWSTLTAISVRDLFVIGGFSGQNEPLSDAYVIQLDFNSNEAKIIQKRRFMNQAVWDPSMDKSTWSRDGVFDPVPRMWHSTSLANDGRVYVFGGCHNNLILYVEKIQRTIESGFVLPMTLYQLSLWVVYKFYYKDAKNSIRKWSKDAVDREMQLHLPPLIFNDLLKLCI